MVIWDEVMEKVSFPPLSLELELEGRVPVLCDKDTVFMSETRRFSHF